MAVRVGCLGVRRERLELAIEGMAGHVAARAAAVDDQVDQAVRPQPVGAVDAHAGALARRVEAGDDRARGVADDPAVDVGRHAAHRVVGRRLDRHRLADRVDAEVGAGRTR